MFETAYHPAEAQHAPHNEDRRADENQAQYEEYNQQYEGQQQWPQYQAPAPHGANGGQYFDNYYQQDQYQYSNQYGYYDNSNLDYQYTDNYYGSINGQQFNSKEQWNQYGQQMRDSRQSFR